MSDTSVSVVIPTLGGGDRLATIVERLDLALGARPYEVILVDDGSPPGTWEVIQALVHARPTVVGVRLAATAGQLPALFAGVQIATGAVIATLDDDLEIGPEEVPRLLEAIDRGADAASGHRTGRTDGTRSLRRVLSRCYWWAMRRAFGLPFDDPGCGLKAFDRRILDEVGRIPSATLGIRGLWEAGRRAKHPVDVPVVWREGERPSTYHAGRLAALAVDLVVHIVRSRIRRPSRSASAASAIAEVLRGPGLGSAPGHGRQVDLRGPIE